MEITEKQLNSLRLGREKSIAKAKDKFFKEGKRCVECNKHLSYKQRRNKFCGHPCSASFTNRKIHNPQWNTVCAFCSKNLPEKTKRTFCSLKCYWEKKYFSYVSDWKEGKVSGVSPNGNVVPSIRRYLLEKKGIKCWSCGWAEVNMYSKRVPLEVDHIDGDCWNNLEDNLRVLCPNCHSLTPTFRGLNKGSSGRKWRRKDKSL